MGYYAGRSDTMIKLRGINLYPEEIGKLVIADPRVEPDYFIALERVGDRDEMTVSVATNVADGDREDVAADLTRQLRERFEVRIGVDLVRPGDLDARTGAGVVGKLRRFQDSR
jgi:phenylacetate-CoA ligase